MQQWFAVSRMTLEEDVVMDDALHWTKHSDATPLCWLNTVTQDLQNNADTTTKHEEQNSTE